MKDEVVIEVNDLCKNFKLFPNPKLRLIEAVHPFRKKYHHIYPALNDVSFSIKKGESIGILGKNGAGKSTLLKLLTGVLTPTSGKIKVKGRIAALLELGSGFNPELSGKDNIYFQGAIIGFDQIEMKEKLPKIIDFADIGEFIDQPVKTYSSGMFARLAFSIAINVDPDILIVDEALSVGDAYFQSKCLLKMQELQKNKDMTLLFVSHSTFAVRNLCERSMLLEKGKLTSIGPTPEVVEQYFHSNIKSSQSVIDDINSEDTFSKACSIGRIQNGKASFTNVEILNDLNQKISKISYNDKVNLRLSMQILEDTDNLGFAFHVRNQDGIEVLFSGSGINIEFLEDLKKGTKIQIDNIFEVPLIQGAYSIAVVLSKIIDAQKGLVEFYDFIPVASSFEMEKREPVAIHGLVGINNQCSIKFIE